VPTVALGEPQTVQAGGFKIRPPSGYDVDVSEAQLAAFDRAGTVIIVFSGATSNPQRLAAEAIAEAYLEAAFEAGDGEYTIEMTSPIVVSGVTGWTYELAGRYGGAPTRGRAALLMPDSERYVFGLGLANLARDPRRWDREGSRVFDAMLDTVAFVEVEAGGTCRVSVEADYGYSQENPIQVGGDWLDGPPRERAYLDNLRGPGGEALAYTRLRSVPVGETILDEYKLTGLGPPVVLYLDMYKYHEPLAPVGFTCAGAFPLEAP
jgi:hypothetical protein